jgi:hypothetical protein
MASHLEASGPHVLLGAWLMASPWILGFAGRDPVWACLVTGFLVATLGFMRAGLTFAAVLGWISVLLAAWTLSTALWLYDDPAATSNAAIVGIAALMFLSASAGGTARETLGSRSAG